MSGTQTTQTAGGSLSDLLTTAKNLVTAINALTQAYLSVQGAQNFTNVTVPTVIKASSGRVCEISVTVAGSAPGAVYDGATTSATGKALYVIPNTVGVYVVNLPTSFGLLVVPGSGMTVAGSWS